MATSGKPVDGVRSSQPRWSMNMRGTKLMTPVAAAAAMTTNELTIIVAIAGVADIMTRFLRTSMAAGAAMGVVVAAAATSFFLVARSLTLVVFLQPFCLEVS